MLNVPWLRLRGVEESVIAARLCFVLSANKENIPLRFRGSIRDAFLLN